MNNFFIFAAMAVGQFQISPGFEIRQGDAKRTYADAFYAAQKAHRPLVIFVDCKAPSFHHAPSYEWVEVGAGEWFDLTGKVERGVIVALGNTVFKRLPPTAAVNDISREASRALAPVQPPRRVIRSPTQIEWGGAMRQSVQC